MTQVVKGPTPLPDWKGCCVSIGNFDGVHLGHRELVRALRLMADKHDCPGVVMTFFPHPAVVIKNRIPRRLLSIDDRARKLLSLGADGVWVVPFDRDYAAASADAFVHGTLVDALAARGIVVGPDFRFGAGRGGDAKLLTTHGRKFGFDVHVVPPFLVGQTRVSSSAIRALLLAGGVEEAGRMLGHPYRVKGKVVRGMQVGTKIGFPTANIELFDNVLIPANGIYIVRLRLGDVPASAAPYDGVANVGTRPTLEADGAVWLEAHLFGVDRPLYGETVTMEILQRLRAEKKFDSLGELVDAIKDDVARARAYFDEQKPEK